MTSIPGLAWFDNTMRQHLVKAKRRRVTGAWKACNDATWKSDWRTGDG